MSLWKSHITLLPAMSGNWTPQCSIFLTQHGTSPLYQTAYGAWAVAKASGTASSLLSSVLPAGCRLHVQGKPESSRSLRNELKTEGALCPACATTPCRVLQESRSLALQTGHQNLRIVLALGVTGPHFPLIIKYSQFYNHDTLVRCTPSAMFTCHSINEHHTCYRDCCVTAWELKLTF